MTLTEKWKNDKLENDWYYVRTTNGIEKWEYIKQSHGFGYYETEWVLEVLAPVPSYEEWQELNKEHNLFGELCERLLCVEEKQWENIVKTKSKKQQIEFLSDKTKFSFLALFDKNQQLKELLKECLNEIHELAEIQDNRSVTIYNFLSAELITKITNAIGEK